MSLLSSFKKVKSSVKSLFTNNNSYEPTFVSTNEEFEFSKTDLPPSYEEAVNNTTPPPSYEEATHVDFFRELDKTITEGNEISARCNQSIKEARAKYPFLNQPKKVANQIKFFEELSHKNTQNDKPLKSNINNPTSIKDKIKFFKSHNINNLKNTFSNIFSKSSISKLKHIVDNIDNKLIYKTLMKLPENELGMVFEKITYGKLADLINNLSDKKAKKLVSHILPEHFEKVINLISADKLNKLFNPDTNITLDDLTEQALQKLSDENISDKKLEDIVILVGEKKIMENSNNIPQKNLEIIQTFILDFSLELSGAEELNFS